MGRIKAGLVSGVWVLMLLVAVFGVVLSVPVVRAGGTIYIRADGSIDPLDAPISILDNITYTFAGNINDSIVVERDNIVVDGGGYTIQGTGGGEGMDLRWRRNVTIRNMEIKAFNTGIWLYFSSNNSISGNNITDNLDGIWLEESSNNSISGNNITVNERYGIRLYASNNILRSNSMANNKYNFEVFGWSLPKFLNDVDDSNTVDGKPVYYWINERDRSVPFEAGYVALVNCTRMTVKGLDLTKNEPGILLAYTTNSTIAQNNIANDGYGIWLFRSFNNSISDNNMTNNMDGIELYWSWNNSISGNNIRANERAGIRLWYYSNYNSVLGNNIANDEYGIEVSESLNNTISGNNITANRQDGVWLYWSSNSSILGNNITANNRDGIGLYWSSNYNSVSRNNIVANNRHGIGLYDSLNNNFCHNNFIDNFLQVYIYTSGYANVWDDGYPSGGNYWSDYVRTGVDFLSGPFQNETGSDGIGDSAYWISPPSTPPELRQIDHYPLMGTFHSFDTSLGYYVDAISNSTIEDFEYFESNNTIIMHVSSMTSNQTFGFIRICIPHALMNETYHVTIDRAEPYYVNYTLYDNSTHRWIYFNYEHSKLEIVIIPESSSFLVLPLFMIATLLAVMVCRRRYSTKDVKHHSVMINPSM